jgi:hypothetical protein
MLSFDRRRGAMLVRAMGISATDIRGRRLTL